MISDSKGVQYESDRDWVMSHADSKVARSEDTATDEPIFVHPWEMDPKQLDKSLYPKDDKFKQEPFRGPTPEPKSQPYQQVPESKGGVLSDVTPDEIKPGQQYTEDITRRRGQPAGNEPLVEGVRLANARGGTDSDFKLKLTDKSSYGIHQYDMVADGKKVGGITLHPQRIKDNEVLYIDYTHGFKVGATPTERLQAALQFRKALSEAHPEAVGVYGHRVTGGKATYGGKENQYVPLKEGWDRKSLEKLVEGEFGTSRQALRPVAPTDWNDPRVQEALATIQRQFNSISNPDARAAFVNNILRPQSTPPVSILREIGQGMKEGATAGLKAVGAAGFLDTLLLPDDDSQLMPRGKTEPYKSDKQAIEEQTKSKTKEK